MQPIATVLMPVYNGQTYLKEAIDSILGQTFADFEFLIIDDGSTDDSLAIAKSYIDPRIRIIENERNLKLIATLNKGLALAQGQYIVRMDCDDIAVPERLQKQVEFMEANPNVGVCGSWIKFFGAASWVYRYPVESDAIKAGLFFENMLAHPTVIIRKLLIDDHHLSYDEADLHAEDFGLWQRCSRITKIANFPEVLLYYRVHANSISHVHRNSQLETEKKLAERNLSLLGIDASSKDLDIYFANKVPHADKGCEFLLMAEDWHRKLIERNQECKAFPVAEFKQAVGRHWFETCYQFTHFGLKVCRLFWSSPLHSYIDVPLKRHVKFVVKCVLKFENYN